MSELEKEFLQQKHIQEALKSLKDALKDAFANKEVFILSDTKIKDILYKMDRKDYYNHTLDYKKMLESFPVFFNEKSPEKIYRLHTGLKDRLGEDIIYYLYFPNNITEEVLEAIYARTLHYIAGRITEFNRLLDSQKDLYSSTNFTGELKKEYFDLSKEANITKIETILVSLFDYMTRHFEKFERMNVDDNDLAILFQLIDIIIPMYEDKSEEVEKQNQQAQLSSAGDNSVPQIPNELITILTSSMKRLGDVIMEPGKYPILDKELAMDIKLYLFGIFFPNELSVFLQKIVTKKIVKKEYAMLPGRKAADDVNTYLDYIESYLEPDLKGEIIHFKYEPKSMDIRHIFVFTNKFKKTLLHLSRSEKRRIRAIDKTTLYIIFERLIESEDENFLQRQASRFGMSYDEFVEVMRTIYELYKSVKLQ